MRTCTKCLKDRHLQDFSKDKKGKEGRKAICKDCAKTYSKRYREEHPDKARSSSLSSYYKYRDVRREQRARFYEENSERIKKRQREYYRRTSDYWREYSRRYRERNPDKFRMYASRRRARKELLTDTLTMEEVDILLERFDRKCAVCKNEYEHMDHFIPISSGYGGTYYGNTVPMCAKCNLSKGNKNPFVWAETLSKYERENFDALVAFLAESNGIMCVSEYEAHVTTCFK